MVTQSQQRAILAGLPASRKMAVKKYCRACEQHGDGIKDILKKVGDFLGPIAKDVGPKVLKEFIIPLLLKKAKEHYGVGLSPAGSGLSPAGGSLKLAGQGKKTSPWIAHCKKVAKEQGLSYKDAMKVASKTYKK
jgi:hypothetical protein